MSRDNNSSTPLLISLVLSIVVVLGVVIAGVFMSSKRQTVVLYPQGSGTVEVKPDGTIVLNKPAEQTAPEAPAIQVVTAKIPAVPAVENALDPVWDSVPKTEIPLDPQQMVQPNLEKGTIASVTVQSARDSNRLAFRLNWPCSQPSTHSDTGTFPDQCAIQVQLVDDAPYTMGAKGLPVRICLWKATWQKDLDEGYQDVNKLYPNTHVDLYWFADKSKPNFPLTLAFADPKAQQFMPALAAGNPMADFKRTKPVEEIAAEGFGSVTHVKETPANAKGVWKDGRWYVVIDRPFDTADPVIARLQQKTANVNFAVWDGSGSNRGARKHYCTWIPIKVEP